MDRISAIRNIEEAIREFEDGEADLAETERQVAAVLRTYATEFDGEDDVFRAVGDDPFDGTVVVAPSEPAARERILDRADATAAETTDTTADETQDGRADATSNGAPDATADETLDAAADATFEIERL